MTGEATILLRQDGTYADASAGALEILGVTLDQLLAMGPGAFQATAPDPDADAAFRAQWEEAGRPDIGGETTIHRPDGGTRRVKFHITPFDDGRFAAVLELVDASDAATTVYTAGEALAGWREAERNLEALIAGSPEWLMVQADIARFRRTYQDVFAAIRGGRRPA